MCSGVPLPSWQYTTIPCCDSTSDITYLLMFLVSYSLNCIVVFVLHLHQHSSCHQSAQRRTLVDWMFIVVTAQCTCLECTDSICQMSSTYLAFWRELKMLLFKASFRDDQTWSWHVRTYSSCNSHPCFGCWCFMLWRIRNVSLLLLLLLLLIAQLYTWLYAPKVYLILQLVWRMRRPHRAQRVWPSAMENCHTRCALHGLCMRRVLQYEIYLWRVKSCIVPSSAAYNKP